MMDGMTVRRAGFWSLLFSSREEADKPRRSGIPSCFKDLCLDQVLSVPIEESEKHGLSGVYTTPLRDRGCIRYRQEVLRSLRDGPTRDCCRSFSMDMHAVGEESKAIRTAVRQNGWDERLRGRLLSCVENYITAIDVMSGRVGRVTLESKGLSDFASYLESYRSSPFVREMVRDVDELRCAFDSVRYCMLVKGNTIKVRKYAMEKNLSWQIQRAFEPFRGEEAVESRGKLEEDPYDEHTEASILSLVARLFPEPFEALHRFSETYASFPDRTLLRFGDELVFYLSWLAVEAPLRSAGLPFCFPSLPASSSPLSAHGIYDIALAEEKLKGTVTNDFFLNADERIIIVTGPNQGGKTTFARAFGQLHYLASLGLSVPGADGDLLLSDKVLTHFEKEEKADSGQLKADLERLTCMLSEATESSVVIINEIFSSTTEYDATILGKKMIAALKAKKSLTLVVTFLEDLAKEPGTVSMVGLMYPGETEKRTYKIVRKAADGLSFAQALAEKHGLTEKMLEERLP